MIDIPEEVIRRRDNYCALRSLTIEQLRGWGVDGFVFQSNRDSILKVFRRQDKFAAERAVYARLSSLNLTRLHGFRIPTFLDCDEQNSVLELSYVSPPYILDFAAATLDRPDPEFNPDDSNWLTEKSRLFGEKWAEVRNLLSALRQYGINYIDVHNENIRV